MRFITLLFLFGILYANAQSSYIPLGSYSIHVLDRIEIKQGRLASPAEYNTATRAYLRKQIAHFADSFDLAKTPLSKQDLYNLQYLKNDNFEFSTSEETLSKRQLGKTGIYKHKAAFYDIQVPDLKVIINPITYQKIEYDRSQKEYLYLNNRGVELRGSLGQKLGFYTLINDEIQRLNSWNQNYYNHDSVIPGQAFLKTSDYRTFNYYLASGYISYQPAHFMDIQFGQSRNFIGNGYRSFMMTDFSRDNVFLRINTHLWRINYTNIWGQMLDYVSNKAYNFPKRHYYATTYMNVNITKRLNVGLFQTISFQRDSGYSDGGYDLQYLNPIIFYKAVENGLNSPDKTILGMDAKYNFAKHFSTYGQFVISEFKFDSILARTGWAGNKFAIQLGLKYIDVLGIRNLDLQLEHNRARPYMYSSFTSRNAYVNYNQNMAHPTGANFKENIIILRYQPINKLFITAKTIISTYGNDTNGSNWGKDIRKPFSTYEQPNNNEIGQGVTTKLYVVDFIASYMLKHNIFIDLQFTYRKTSSVLSLFDTKTLNPAIAFRWNINARGCDF